ncbi:hypothetical protein As57867_006829, partial [Aphanomyces stellatus]
PSKTKLFMHAVQFAPIEAVCILSQRRGFNVNQTNKNGDTALHLAAAQYRLDVIQVLLACDGIDVHLMNVHGTTVLMAMMPTLYSTNRVVAFVERLQCVEALFRTHNDSTLINHKNEHGHTALSLLLLYISNEQGKSKTRSSKSQVAFSNLVTTICQHSALDVNVDLPCSEHFGSLDSEVDGDSLTRFKGLSFSFQSLPAVSWVLALDLTDAARVLLRRSGSEIHMSKAPPIMFAVAFALADIVREMCQRPGVGLDSIRHETTGDTLLHMAAKQGRVDTLDVLLEFSSFDVNAVNNVGDSVFVVALALLLGHNAKLLQNKDKTDAQNVVERLLPIVDVNRVDKDGRTPLEILFRASKVTHNRRAHASIDTLASTLCQLAQLDINKTLLPDEDQTWALSWAMRFHLPKTVEAIVTRRDVEGIDVACENGLTPLQWTIEQGETQIVRQLCTRDDVDVNRLNSVRICDTKQELHVGGGVVGRPNTPVPCCPNC